MLACLPLHPAFVTLQFPLFSQKRQVFFLACGVNMRLQRFSLVNFGRSPAGSLFFTGVSLVIIRCILYKAQAVQIVC